MIIFFFLFLYWVKTEREIPVVDEFISCGYQTFMSWKTRVSSHIHQTPQIVDFFDDDQKEILIPTSNRFVEGIDGKDGEELEGWPWSHPHFTSTSSTLLFDINFDGETEILVSTFDGEILFINQHGEMLNEYTIKIPPLLVDKNWYAGLDLDDIDVSMELRNSRGKRPGRETLTIEDDDQPKLSQTEPPRRPSPPPYPQEKKIPDSEEIKISDPGAKKSGPPVNTEDTKPFRIPESTADQKMDKNKLSELVEKQSEEKQKEAVLPATSPYSRRKRRRRRKKSHTQKSALSKSRQRITTQDGWWSDAAHASLHLIFDPEVEDEAFEFLEASRLQPPNYHVEYQRLHREALRENKVLVDAHIMSTPAIVDLYGDGKKQLIVSISYFYDPEYYSYAEHMRKLPVGLDIKKYIAGGLVAIDLESRKLLWSLHLDLTARKEENSALIYTSPTIIDFDSNGSLDILLSNSMGHLYAVSRDGEVMPGFPIMMRETQGMVLAEDLTGDGSIEVCAMDLKANYVCYTDSGGELWSHSLHEHFPEHVDDEFTKHRSRYSGVVGDVNGDGNLNIVLSFSNGLLFALDATNGEILDHYPVKIKGEIHAPISLIDFHEKEFLPEDEEDKTPRYLQRMRSLKAKRIQEQQKKDGTTPSVDTEYQTHSNKIMKGNKNKHHGLDIIFPSYNGKVYVLNSERMCVHMIDVGEESMSRILVDDLTNDGTMELLVSSINGDVTCIGTKLPYHPLKTVIGETRYENGFSYRMHHLGIYVPKSSRQYRDIVGSRFTMSFVIHDRRKLPKMFARKYNVKISVGEKIVLFEESYEEPGRKTVTLNVPNERMKGTVYVSMVNEHGQLFVDSFSISFNMRFLRVLKWAVLVPFLMALFFIYGVGELQEVKEITKSVLPN